MGLVLDAGTFGRAAAFGFYTRDYLKGANGYGHAAAAVLDHERQAAGTGAVDTDECRCRRFVVLPGASALVALTAAGDDGHMTLQAFEPSVDSGD